MILPSPPSYLLAATFRSQATGVIAALIAGLSDTQLQAVLTAATGRADAIMCQSLLAREETRYYPGTGTQTLDINETPLVYIRQIAFAQPGLGGLIIPTQNILIDYASGELITFTPLLLQGAGYVSHFPYGIELAVRAAWGYAYAVPPPSFTILDTLPADAFSLTPGSYDVAVTSVTTNGESTATPVTVPTGLGAFEITVTPQMGAERYRVYIAPTGGPPADLQYVEELQATSFESGPLVVTVSSLVPPPGFFPETLPQTDTSATPVPAGVVEATRLLANDMLLEDSNVANVGIAKDGDTQYRRGEDSAAKSSGSMLRAEALLAPFRYIGVF